MTLFFFFVITIFFEFSVECKICDNIHSWPAIHIEWNIVMNSLLWLHFFIIFCHNNLVMYILNSWIKSIYFDDNITKFIINQNKPVEM